MKIYDYQWFILSWMPFVFFLNEECFSFGFVVSIGLLAKAIRDEAHR